MVTASVENMGSLPTVGSNLVGRYRLTRVVGSGSSGTVYAADDRLSDAPVAVKVLNARGREAARLRRREAAALRRLRVPGVVELIDEGVERGVAFVVTALVAGQPFPGPRAHDLVGLLRDTLSILADVHALGLVHRDLKPQNVLVAADGVTLLDFGMAVEHTGKMSSPATAFYGTPRYCSPEQRFGQPVDSGTDLYALGLMAAECVMSAEQAQRFLLSRMLGGTASLRVGDLNCPNGLADLICQMAQTERERRPAGALQALELLGAPEPDELNSLDRIFAGREVVDVSELATFIDGPDRIFHARSDATAIMLALTSGERSRVRAVARTWVRGGIAAWRGGMLRVDAAGMERLRASVATGWHDTSAAEQEVRARCAELSALGKHALASELLIASLRGLRFDGAPHDEDLLMRLVHHVARADDPRLLELASYELGRVSEPSETVVALCSLVDALMLSAHGEGDRALAVLDGLDGQLPELLDADLFGCRALALRRSHAANSDEHVRSIRRRYETAALGAERAYYAWMLARHAYREERFAEAAHLHLEESSMARGPEKARALTFCASALMELFDFERAESHAREAIRCAREHRHAVYEARAERVCRDVLRRTHRATAVDTELVAAARELLDIPLRALLLLNEASVAWRLSDRELAHELAVESLSAWRLADSEAGLGVAAALASATTGEDTSASSLARRALETLDAVPKVIALQIIALVPARLRPKASTDALLQSVRQGIAREHWHTPIDVLSLAECAERLLSP